MPRNRIEYIAATTAPSLAIFVAAIVLAIITLDGNALFFGLIVWIASLPWQLTAIPLFIYLYRQFKNQSMPLGLATLFSTGAITLLQAAATYLLTNTTMLFAVLILGPLSGLCFALLSQQQGSDSLR